jgi:hypothetical protein
MTRAVRSLWVLIGAAIIAVGILAQALAAPASTAADLLVGGSALLLAVSAALLIRVLRHLVRAPVGTGSSDTGEGS